MWYVVCVCVCEREKIYSYMYIFIFIYILIMYAFSATIYRNIYLGCQYFYSILKQHFRLNILMLLEFTLNLQVYIWKINLFHS